MAGQFQNYAGEPKDVQRIARNIVIGGGGRLEDLGKQDPDDFIHDADEVINSKLGSVYLIPITQITRDSETFFPHPIPNIARRIAASLMVQSVYSDIDQNTSQNAVTYGTQAISELEALAYGVLRGDRHLEGQKPLAKNNFANPRVVPRENLPTPRSAL